MWMTASPSPLYPMHLESCIIIVKIPGFQLPYLLQKPTFQMLIFSLCNFPSRVLATLLLLCFAPLLMKMTKFSYYLQQRITIDPGTSYRLQGLKPNSLYYFRLAARSPQGLGASTTEISARTMQSSRCLSLLPSCLFSLGGIAQFYPHPQTELLINMLTHQQSLCQQAFNFGD